MVVDKSRVDKLGCYSTNGIHIICTFEISICFVNWNRVHGTLGQHFSFKLHVSNMVSPLTDL